jgi:hypothetical protein
MTQSLTELQEERTKAFRRLFDNDGFVLDLAAEPITTHEIIHFIKQSIQLGWSAGGKQSQEAFEALGRSITEDSIYKKGFIAGLERAKELIPNEYIEKCGDRASDMNFAHNECRKEVISAIDQEILHLKD